MPQDLPLVSVVIPTYNRARVLPEAIDSALGQSYPRIEVIVVDDGSTDHTPRVLESYGDRILSIRKENGGVSSARNLALRAAQGRYVAWLDSDDIWLPEKTALQVALMEAHPEIVLVSSDFSAFGDGGLVEATDLRSYYSAISRTPQGMEGLYTEAHRFETGSVPGLETQGLPVLVRVGDVHEKLVRGNFIHPPTVMIRRSCALQVEGLDETLANAMEYEYFLRLSRVGPFGFIERPLLRYRYSPGQLSSDDHALDMQASVLRIVEEIQKREPAWVREHRGAYRQRLGQCHVELALVLAEQQRIRALRHLARSWRLLYADTKTLRALARLALPSGLLRLYRLYRRARSSR